MIQVHQQNKNSSGSLASKEAFNSFIIFFEVICIK